MKKNRPKEVRKEFKSPYDEATIVIKMWDDEIDGVQDKAVSMYRSLHLFNTRQKQAIVKILSEAVDDEACNI